MSEFLPNAAAVDLAFACIALEGVLFLAWRRPPSGLRFTDVIGQLLAGAFLLVALRLALRGTHPAWVTVMLSASFPAHLFDLARRRERGRHERGAGHANYLTSATGPKKPPEVSGISASAATASDKSMLN